MMLVLLLLACIPHERVAIPVVTEVHHVDAAPEPFRCVDAACINQVAYMDTVVCRRWLIGGKLGGRVPVDRPRWAYACVHKCDCNCGLCKG